MERAVNLSSIKMTSQAGLNLECRSANVLNSCAITRSSLITFDYRYPPRALPTADSGFEQCGLPRTRRSHEIVRKNLSFEEMLAIVHCGGIIGREQPRVDVDSSNSLRTTATGVTH